MTGKNKVLSFRLGGLEEAFYSYCKKEDLRPSEVVKLALRAYLLAGRKPEKDISFSVGKMALDSPKKRIEITLTESELEALETVMNVTIHRSYQAVIVGILRAYFLNKPVFSTKEVEALRQANTALNAMGRNFNQVIKLIHLGEMEAARVLNETNIEKILEAIEKHASYCRQVVNESTLRTKFNKDLA